ncbi:MAG: hypothetical protein H7A34_02815 [bacterium]|nr:hypothetical protein [bacterium]
MKTIILSIILLLALTIPCTAQNAGAEPRLKTVNSEENTSAFEPHNPLPASDNDTSPSYDNESSSSNIRIDNPPNPVLLETSSSNNTASEPVSNNQVIPAAKIASETQTVPQSDNDTNQDTNDLDIDIEDEIDFIEDLDSEESTGISDETSTDNNSTLDDMTFDDLIGIGKDNDTLPTVSHPSEPAPEILDESEIRRLELALSTGPADVLLLISGDTEEGVIREKTGEIITLETQFGMEIFNREDIEFIEEISEEERFETLHIIEKLQRYHQQQELIRWHKQKLALSKQELKATRKQHQLDIITDQHNPDLFSLTGNRLEEIIKDFSQFPPDYWRYYHRKSDVFKTLLQLKRLKRYAHGDFEPIIRLYIDAFEYKKKELSQEQGSSLSRQYGETYKDRFRMAEKRRLTTYNKE